MYELGAALSEQSALPQNFTAFVFIRSLPVGGLVSGILGFLWIRFVDVDVSVFPDYPGAVLFFLLAGLCELLSEPLAILSQLAGFVRLRAAAEGAAALVKCLLTAGLVSSGLGSGLTPFCVAQVTDFFYFSASHSI